MYLPYKREKAESKEEEYKQRQNLEKDVREHQIAGFICI